MSQNGQTYFKNFTAKAARLSTACLTILRHYALKN